MGSIKRSTSRRRELLQLAPAVLAASLLRGQPPPAEDTSERRLPDGRVQADAMLKADYQQNVKDARELTALAKSIELDFDKSDQNVLSIGLLKKLDDVDKITKRIRGRVRR